jgi:hypothetical protein
MQPVDYEAEKAELEIQLTHYEKLLDKSISDNEEIARTRTIFRELKKIKDRLEVLKEKMNPDNHLN